MLQYILWKMWGWWLRRKRIIRNSTWVGIDFLKVEKHNIVLHLNLKTKIYGILKKNLGFFFFFFVVTFRCFEGVVNPERSDQMDWTVIGSNEKLFTLSTNFRKANEIIWIKYYMTDLLTNRVYTLSSIKFHNTLSNIQTRIDNFCVSISIEKKMKEFVLENRF